VISREQRDRRLTAVEQDRNLYRGLLVEGNLVPDLSAEALAEVFAPFFEWQLLARGAKRRLLSTLIPEIRVADYCLAGVSLLTGAVCRNE